MNTIKFAGEYEISDMRIYAASGNVAFTRLNSITVSSGATFRVGSGTTFAMNVLGVF